MRPGTYTGYDVLRWVIQKVKEEPKRLYMHDWVVMFKGRDRGYKIQAKERPRCGTAACMAGWAGIAAGNAYVTGSWAGLKALGLQDSKLAHRHQAQVSEAQTDFTDLFMMTRAPKQVVITHAQDLAEKHKEVLQAAKVKIKAGWQKAGGRT